MPITTKKIRKDTYIYFVSYDEKIKKQKHICCGSISNSESKKKAIKLELTYLANQNLRITEKRKKLKEELLRIK